MHSLRRRVSWAFAIFALTSAVLAMSGCSGDGNVQPPPPENYADGEGDGGGVVQDPGPDLAAEALVEENGDAGPTNPNPRPPNGCPSLAFPSGVHIQTKPDAAMTAEYDSISDTGSFPKPKCFIDVDDLYDPTTGKVNDVNVMVGKHFALMELVGTELPYGHKVLLSPILVTKLDAYRDTLGTSVDLSSGYRSPAHQRATCRGICGQDSCGGLCAARSRHSWGDAADHAVYPTATYANAGCAARFNFVFREGNHVHLDLNPEHAICTVQIL